VLEAKQILELLSIIEKNGIVFIAKNLGPNYLTELELERLGRMGINPSNLYLPEKDFILQQFYLGLISDAMGKDVQKVTFQDIKEHLKAGKYRPTTFREKATIESIRKQFLGDIRGANGKVFANVNGIINQNEVRNRAAYEKVIRDEVEAGTIKKKTNRQIASDIHHKTGDWSRDFDKIVEYIGHQAFDEGRAALYEKQDGEGAQVYKDVYAGACKHCVRLYLTGGVGSRPLVFKLSELRANGTNIGRRVAELKPVVGSTHPYCRCTLNRLEKGMVWDVEQGKFIRNKEIKIVGRKPVKITFNNKEYNV